MTASALAAPLLFPSQPTCGRQLSRRASQACLSLRERECKVKLLYSTQFFRKCERYLNEFAELEQLFVISNVPYKALSILQRQRTVVRQSRKKIEICSRIESVK